MFYVFKNQLMLAGRTNLAYSASTIRISLQFNYIESIKTHTIFISASEGAL
jgi:hypothetical protein